MTETERTTLSKREGRNITKREKSNDSDFERWKTQQKRLKEAKSEYLKTVDAIKTYETPHHRNLNLPVIQVDRPVVAKFRRIDFNKM